MMIYVKDRPGIRVTVNIAVVDGSGTKVLVAAAAGRQFRLLRFSVTNSVACDIKWVSDGASDVDMSGVYQVPGGASFSGDIIGGYTTAVGSGISLNNSVASKITGDIWYEEVPQ